MTQFYLFCSALIALLVAAAPLGAQTPAASRERPALGSTIPVDALAELPASASVLSLLDAAQADLISDRLDTGGLTTADPSRMGAHGSTWTQTRLRLGPADITDPQGSGSPMLLPAVVAWDRVDVATGLMPVDVNAPGLAVTLQPRRPGDSWTRMIDGFMSRPGLLSRTTPTNPPAIARLHTWNDADLLLGGPISPGRAGLVLAADWTRSSRFERDNPTRLDAAVASAFAHLELTPSPDDSVRTIVWVQRARSPFANRNAFSQPAAAEHKTAIHAQTMWERHVGAETTATVFASFTARDRAPDVLAAPAIVVERLRDGPVPSLLNPRTGSDASWSAGGSVLLPSATMLGAGHSARIGVEVSGSRASTRAGFSGRIGELVDGVPARVWDYADQGQQSVWHDTMVAAYASDRVQLLPGLLLDAAIRFESTGGSAEGAANHVRWTNWLPRASVRWEITQRLGLAAFGGYGRYGYELPLRYFAYGDPAAQVGTVYRWNASNGDRAPLAGEVGDLIARVGPGTGGDPRFSAIDPGLKRPYMDEIVLGFESRPRPSTVFRLAAIARREQQLVGLLDVGAPASSYSLTYIPDPGVDLASTADDQPLPVYNRLRASFGTDRYLLTNPADDRATYVGIDLTGQTTIKHLILIAGGTAGRSEGLSGNRGFEAIENDHGIIGELFTDPNATTFAKGRLFTERGYTLKTAGVYRFPQDLRLGIVARYQDGQHFARLVIVPGLNQGPEAIRAFANGRTRFTYSMTIDARLQKGFTIGGGRFDLIADAYNLLNRAKEVEEFPVTGPTSRLTAAVQPPRAIHLGMRFVF